MSSASTNQSNSEVLVQLDHVINSTYLAGFGHWKEISGHVEYYNSYDRKVNNVLELTFPVFSSPRIVPRFMPRYA